MKKIILLLSLSLAVGCSTYSKKQCSNMDWRSQASELARKGETLTEIKEHFGEACQGKYGIAADEALVEQGYNSGIGALCSTAGAEELANDGGIYKGTCAGWKEGPFLTKYHSVREAHLERKISDLESKVSSLERENNSLESKVRSLESDLSSCKVSH